MSPEGFRRVRDVYSDPNYIGNCQICGMDGPQLKTASILPLGRVQCLCARHEEEFFLWARNQMSGRYLWDIWPSMPENPKNKKRGGRG